MASALTVALALLALFVPLPLRAPWVGGLLDLGHVPLFALLTWSLGRLAGRGPAGAALLALGFALIVEPLQALVGRSGTLADVLRGVCGIAMYLGWRLTEGITPLLRRGAVRLAWALACVAPPVAHDWPLFADAVEAWREFPVLADFSAPREQRRWFLQRCALDCRRDAAGQGVGVLDCLAPADTYSSMVLFPIRRDWSRYRTLHVDFDVDEKPVRVGFSVRDGRRVRPPKRRFDLFDAYEPGRRQVAIDLADVASGSDDVAPINVANVRNFHVIVFGENEPRALRLHRIWLD